MVKNLPVMLETRAFILGFSSPVGGVNIAKSWLL